MVICEVLVPEKHKGWGWGGGGGSYGIWGQWYMGPVVYMGEEGLQVEVTWSAMGRLKNSPVDRCYANPVQRSTILQSLSVKLCMP